MPVGEPAWYADRNPLDGLHLKSPYEDEPAFVLAPLSLETRPGFRVAILADRPQNPILDTLNLSREDGRMSSRGMTLTTLLQDAGPNQLQAADMQVRRNNQPNNALSWNSLKKHSGSISKEAALLSEQSSFRLSAIRYHIDPILKDPRVFTRYCTIEELFASLCLVLTGLSSPLYVWDIDSESFRLRGAVGHEEGNLILMGSDDVVSSSLLRRFLTIGTIIRQLSSFVNREKSSDSVLNAFTSAVGFVLQYVADTVEVNLPKSTVDGNSTSSQSLAAWWSEFAGLEAMLLDLSALCIYFSQIAVSASASSPSTCLLSHLYVQLDSHIRTASPHLSKALFAYILTATSHVYFKRIAATVGYGTSNETYVFEQAAIKSEEDEPSADETRQSLVYPSFFSPPMCHSITVAQKSLKLLKIANITYRSSGFYNSTSDIDWIWTDDALRSLFSYQCLPVSGTTTSNNLLERHFPSKHAYPELLSPFRTFDLDPGCTTTRLAGEGSSATFNQFLEVFPVELPDITPSLQLLSQTVTSPLLTHVNSISRSLVDVFLSASSPYHLPSHLNLLKSYLLMTSSAFKLQLQQALFAFGASAADGGSEDHWVPGLSSKLTASGSWPPAGSSLSLSLRTVILDALAQEYDENRVLTCAVTQKIVKEAEWRLGFAIQDLPTDSGHAQWLNARAIQALDFLYLDYNPPKPLDAVITPSILSKYHRIFVFCLRLMRVESVLQSLTYASKSSFHLQSQELAQIFQHFKFMANFFISTLSNYIFTHVIGGFFDKFLQDFVTEGSIIAFDSVEDLKNSHSQVLDNILSACLLRSHLKSTAKYLYEILEIIFHAGLLMHDCYLGLILEDSILVKMKSLMLSFLGNRNKLIKQLKKINTHTSTNLQLEDCIQTKIAILFLFLN